MLLQNQISTDSINNPIIEEKTLSIIELISSGGIGGNIIMGTLGVLSIYAIYILF
jgi:biopolymer transport protein ExbB